MSSTKLDYYTKLKDHRSEVVEGVRQLAVRNMGHFTVVVDELGVDDISDERNFLAVQEKMLDDQKLRSTKMHRDFLRFLTFVPWEIYTCLVFAELDSYEVVARKNLSLKYAPLDELFDSEQDLIVSMKTVRDKLLHPLKNVSYEDTLGDYMEFVRNVAPDHMLLVIGLQDLIDEYLECLREDLWATFEQETLSLSDQQLYEHVQTIKTRALQLKDKSTDGNIQAAMAKIHSDQKEFESFLDGNIDPDYVLTAKERAELKVWENKKDVLMAPLPRRGLQLEPGSIQTAFHRDLLGLIPDPRTSSESGWLGESLPHYARKWRKDCVGLLMRSLVMLNEPYTAVVSKLQSSYPGKSRKEMVECAVSDLSSGEKATSDEMNLVRSYASHVFVSKALLDDPFRIYRQVTSRHPELKVEGIESRLTADAMKSFHKFRNIVFHVPDERADHFEAELALYENATSLMEPRLIGDLLKFYLSEDVRQRLESVI